MFSREDDDGDALDDGEDEEREPDLDDDAGEAPPERGRDPFPPTDEPSDEPRRERMRKRLERMLPDIIKRGLLAGLAGLGKSDEALRGLIGNTKIPKELAGLILTQIDETKNGLFRAVAHEVRDFLEATDIAGEMKKALTSLSFEIKTEVRFIPNDRAEGGVTPDVKTDVRVKRDAPGEGAVRPRARRK